MGQVQNTVHLIKMERNHQVKPRICFCSQKKKKVVSVCPDGLQNAVEPRVKLGPSPGYSILVTLLGTDSEMCENVHAAADF